MTALRNGRSGDESLNEVTGVRLRDDEIAMLKEEPKRCSEVVEPSISKESIRDSLITWDYDLLGFSASRKLGFKTAGYDPESFGF